MADVVKCECSNYEAFVPEQLTEDNVASGDYDIFSTGCTSDTKRLFAPGHDAKLKSFLIKQHLAGNEIRRNEGGMAISTDAVTASDRYEFGHLVVAGITKGEAAAEAKASRKAAIATKRAEAKAISKAGAAAVAAVKTPTLAQVVADEEAAYAEASAARIREQQAEADWENEATHAREERERDLVKAKVGRWEYPGYVDEDKKFHYRNKGNLLLTAPAGTYTLI